MLTEKIKTHNYINGFIFSALEFIVVAIVILPFCIYYIIHVRVLLAAIAVGLIVNCLTISAFAILSIQKKEKSIGLKFYFDPELKKKAGISEQHLLKDTIILCAALLLPFYLFLVIVYERYITRSPPTRGH